MKIPVTLFVQAQGKDGLVSGVRKISLPFTPFADLWVDGLRVLKCEWLTGSETWRLTLAGYTQVNGEARKNFAGVVGEQNVKGWQVEFKEAIEELRFRTGATA